MAADERQLEAASSGRIGARRGSGEINPDADQRSRLLAAIVELVARDGYPQAKIGELAKLAGVSRATFYELFSDKEECFLHAYRNQADRLSEEIDQALAERGSYRAAQVAIEVLVGFADRERPAFDFMFHEALLAGPSAHAQRDALVGHLRKAIERSWAHAPKDAPVLDMSAQLLIEGALRMVGMNIGRSRDLPPQITPDLLAWVDAYEVPARAPRWQELVPRAAMRRDATRHLGAAALPRSLPKGRHRLGVDVVRTVQRERIAYGTAAAIQEKGYANITVGDIVTGAGVSRDVFYAHFHDKHEAFGETVKLLFEQLLATMASAFFSSPGDWPDRVWEAGDAFARFVEDSPVLAHFLVVGTYAPPDYIDRVNDFVLAFTLFVDDGYRFRPEAADLAPLVSKVLVCAVLEAVTFHVRHDRIEDLRGLIPIIVYMVLAPFMGTEDADRFVQAKISASRSATPAAASDLSQS
jgi:AcrR family transcriptional regulator